jgi:hypothetical protein
MTEQPGYTPAQVIRGLSLPRRIGYVLAGLGGLAGAALVTLLWATEPVPLPRRTELAFAVLINIGLSWAGFAGWALFSRPLFARDRVIAAGLALACSTLTAIGTVTVALARNDAVSALVAAGVGLVLMVVSGTMLLRARAYRATLRTRARNLDPPAD